MTQATNGTRRRARAAIQSTLAATCACAESDLRAAGITVVEAHDGQTITVPQRHGNGCTHI